jgi:hypothetical protein
MSDDKPTDWTKVAGICAIVTIAISVFVGTVTLLVKGVQTFDSTNHAIESLQVSGSNRDLETGAHLDRVEQEITGTHNEIQGIEQSVMTFPRMDELMDDLKEDNPALTKVPHTKDLARRDWSAQPAAAERVQ